MSEGRWEKVKAIVDGALSLAAVERSRFLDRACGADRALRDGVESLLRHQSDSFLEGAHEEAALAGSPALVEGAGDSPELVDATVPFRVLRQLGEGGMGVVYEAEQERPVRRRVALKLIKWGMDTRQVIARFDSERQALAIMNHPSIARVYEAGATTGGRPYFAMELVDGAPVTRYCDERRLSVRERLELFTRICDGVQHAHQKGIIHRDIKPTNILVSLHDGAPVPKIIDFGVAKATSQRLTEHSVYTELGQLIGTPAYMSPEQAALSGLDVDTRTDVYSLGVLLYELLVGALPFDPRTLREAGFEELMRQIRETDPPLPSTRASRPGEASARTALARGTDAPSLARRLRGDLDWIVMRALEKDPARRYETANALARDVQRHLDHEPVRARKPGFAYLAGKFVRRHRLGVAAGLVVAIALLSGTVLAVAGLVRARAAEREATAQAAKALAINAFLQEALGSAHPVEGEGRDVTVREALANAVESAGDALAHQPEVKAAVLHTVGRTYLGLGHYPEARSVLSESLALRRRILGSEHPEVADSLTSLGALLFTDGDYADAEPHFREALAIRRKAYGNRHASVTESLNDIAMTLQQKDRDYAGAEPLLVESLALRRRLLGEDSPEVAQSLNNLAMLYYRMNDFDRAEPLFREAIAINRRLFGDEHVELSTNLSNLGLLLRDKGEVEAATEVFQQVLEMDRRLLGPNHPYVAATLRRLGRLRSRAAADEEAGAFYRAALEAQSHSFAEDHWQVAWTRSLLADSLSRRGRFENAEPLLRESLPILVAELGESHRFSRATLRHLVSLYERWGRPEQAHAFATRLEALGEEGS